MSRLDSIYGQTICGAVSLGGEVRPEVVRDMLEAILPKGRCITLHSHATLSTVPSPRLHWAVASTCKPIKAQADQVWFDGDWELNQFLRASEADFHSIRPESSANAGEPQTSTSRSAVYSLLSTAKGPVSDFWCSLPGGWCGVRIGNTVQLACDRVGLRDLYYTQHDNVFYFSNFIQSFFQIPGWQTGTDASRVSEYMAYRRIAGHHTMYHNVDRVLPGEVISLSGTSGSWAKNRYWTYHWHDNDNAASAETLLKQLEQQLQAIRDDHDLDPMLMLSGGVDSAGLLAESCRIGYSMPSLSLTPDDANFSEHQGIQSIHHHLGTKGETIDIGASALLRNMRESHAVLEQPVVHTIALLHMELYREAGKGGRNAFLCGEAADTLFGYDRFARYHQVWRYSNPLLDGLIRMVAKTTQNSKALLWANLTSKGWMEFVCKSRAYFDDQLLQDIVRDWSDPHQKRMDILRESMSEMESRSGGCARMADMRVEACSRYYFETFIQDCRIFVALGRAAGMEPILPYASTAIRDLALSLPVAKKFHGRVGKYLLKKAMDPHLPKQVVWGRKRSGEQPLGRWMREDKALRQLLDEVCQNGSPVEEYLQMDSIRRCLREHMEQRQDWSVLLWQVLSLHMWLGGGGS